MILTSQFEIASDTKLLQEQEPPVQLNKTLFFLHYYLLGAPVHYWLF